MLIATAAISQDPWLDMGVVGAALFIVLVIVCSMFSQQKQSIDKLCEKIDSVVTSFAENNTKLTEVIISNDKDQKELLTHISTMAQDIKEVLRRVTRMDTRVHDAFVDSERRNKEEM